MDDRRERVSRRLLSKQRTLLTKGGDHVLSDIRLMQKASSSPTIDRLSYRFDGC